MQLFPRSALATVVVTATIAVTGLATAVPAGAAPAPSQSLSTIHYTAPKVAFGKPLTSLVGGDPARLLVTVARALPRASSVRVTTHDDTAIAGEDYTAVDRRVTIPAGKKSVVVEVPTEYQFYDPETLRFTATLSSPSKALRLGSPRTITVDLYAGGPPPLGGGYRLIDDFEAGVPDTVRATTNFWPARPRLSTVAAQGGYPGNEALRISLPSHRSRVMTGIRSTTGVSGVWEGFDLTFLGKGTGKRFSLLFPNGGQLFEYVVTDDSVGWRDVRFSFEELRVQGQPTSAARYDAYQPFTEYRLDLSRLPAGNWQFDTAYVWWED